jgi:nicotinamidase-related amidase
MLTSPWTQAWVSALAKAGAPWIGTMDDPEADLSALGWQAWLAQYGEEEANYGRWPYPVMPRTLPDMPRTWLVTAHRN